MPPVNPSSTNLIRTQARVLAMQALYQLDVQGDKNIDNTEGLLADSDAPEAVIDYSRGLNADPCAPRDNLDN